MVDRSKLEVPSFGEAYVTQMPIHKYYVPSVNDMDYSNRATNGLSKEVMEKCLDGLPPVRGGEGWAEQPQMQVNPLRIGFGGNKDADT